MDWVQTGTTTSLSSRLQLDVRNLSLGMRHLVNAYEVEAGTVCNLQVTLCDPYPSALSVRYYNKAIKALYKSTSLSNRCTGTC